MPRFPTSDGGTRTQKGSGPARQNESASAFVSPALFRRRPNILAGDAVPGLSGQLVPVTNDEEADAVVAQRRHDAGQQRAAEEKGCDQLPADAGQGMPVLLLQHIGQRPFDGVVGMVAAHAVQAHIALHGIEEDNGDGIGDEGAEDGAGLAAPEPEGRGDGQADLQAKGRQTAIEHADGPALGDKLRGCLFAHSSAVDVPCPAPDKVFPVSPAHPLFLFPVRMRFA